MSWRGGGSWCDDLLGEEMGWGSLVMEVLLGKVRRRWRLMKRFDYLVFPAYAFPMLPLNHFPSFVLAAKFKRDVLHTSLSSFYFIHSVYTV